VAGAAGGWEARSGGRILAIGGLGKFGLMMGRDGEWVLCLFLCLFAACLPVFACLFALLSLSTPALCLSCPTTQSRTPANKQNHPNSNQQPTTPQLPHSLASFKGSRGRIRGGGSIKHMFFYIKGEETLGAPLLHRPPPPPPPQVAGRRAAAVGPEQTTAITAARARPTSGGSARLGSPTCCCCCFVGVCVVLCE
jgi:hypothetical protein